MAVQAVQAATPGVQHHYGGVAHHTVSVGAADWAGQVIDNVVGNWEAAAADNNTVRDRVRDKIRQFHNGRPLELKNLPDGVTEQV